MKKILISLALLPIVTTASPLPDEIAICYKFKNNKIINKGTCIISSGNFVGGLYTNIQYKGKTYSYGSTGDSKTDSKGYRRDSYFNKIPDSDPLVSNDENEIVCYNGKPYDICYK